MMEENQMSKKLKAVLSFALALVLVMSLGVSAFADSSNAEKQKEKEPEIVQIAFNLATGEACAVRMRELGYDDIRLDGVSYKADAEDGVIAIQLGDLAAAKLLRENTAKAKDLGIDYAKLYIRGGRVLVKDDTGLSSDEIAALKKAVATLMGSVRVGVNIGDIFDLANGEKVKLRVQVCNFIYPAPKDDSIKVKVVDEKNAGKLFNLDKYDNPISAKVPEKTTVYFYYDEKTTWKQVDDTKFEKEKTPNETRPSSVGIAKDKNDKTTYYIQLGFDGGNRDGIEEAKDLTTTKDAKSFGDAVRALYDKTLGWAKTVFVSTDKDGKNVVKTIDIKDATPSGDKALSDQMPSEYTRSESGATTTYTPDKNAEVTHDKGDKAEVTVRDKVEVKKEITPPTDDSTISTTTVSAPVSAAALTDSAKAAADEQEEHVHICGGDVTTTPPTCTEAGAKAYTCSCGAKICEIIPATGHKYDANGVCSVCGAKDPAYTPAPAPEPEPAAAPAPTSTEHTERTPTPEPDTPPSDGGGESGGSADAGNGGDTTE